MRQFRAQFPIPGLPGAPFQVGVVGVYEQAGAQGGRGGVPFSIGFCFGVRGGAQGFVTTAEKRRAFIPHQEGHFFTTQLRQIKLAGVEGVGHGIGRFVDKHPHQQRAMGQRP